MVPALTTLLALGVKGIVTMNFKRYLLTGSLLLSVICFGPVFATAQDSATVLVGAELTRVVPPGFYFQGLSAPTQMRNSAAAIKVEQHNCLCSGVSSQALRIRNLCPVCARMTMAANLLEAHFRSHR
jgi:hypothetical protein